MNLQQFINEIVNIKPILERFGLKKAILHNIGNDEDDDILNYHPIRLCVTPCIPVSQTAAFSFVLSQLYDTKFEIQSLDETDSDLLPFLDPNNGVDILGNEPDRIKEMVLKIFEISEEELQTVEFSTPKPTHKRQAPKEWQALLEKERQLTKGLSNDVTDEYTSALQKGIRLEVVPRIAEPVIFTQKRDIPATPPQSHLSEEEESPPRKLAKKLDLVAHRSEHPEEFLEIVKSFMTLANTPENQQACLHEIDALIMQTRLPKPLISNQ